MQLPEAFPRAHRCNSGNAVLGEQRGWWAVEPQVVRWCKLELVQPCWRGARSEDDWALGAWSKRI